MGYNMNKSEYQVKIHYIQFADGTVPAAELIQYIARTGKRDPLFAQLAKHIRVAMDTLKRYGVPDWNIRGFSYEWAIPTEKGWIIRTDPLVKRLKYAFPLFELRINVVNQWQWDMVFV
jgi:hypothetical protein